MLVKELPKLRDADKNSLVGVRGFLNFFQDVATVHMHSFNKGNDVIPDQYNICWMYTKYLLVLNREVNFDNTVDVETWIEKEKTTAVIRQAMEITQNGEFIAKGRLESCLVDMASRRLTKPAMIEFPMDVFEERHVDLRPFMKLPKTSEGMEYIFTHCVRYSDLDRNNHMTNLKYVPLLMDAFESDFYDTNTLCEMEIHYLSQCFYREEVDIFKKPEGEGYLVAVVHKDGTVATMAFMKFRTTMQ